MHAVYGGANVVKNAIVADESGVLEEARAVLDHLEALVGVKHVDNLGEQRRLRNVEEGVHDEEPARAQIMGVDEGRGVTLQSGIAVGLGSVWSTGKRRHQNLWLGKQDSRHQSRSWKVPCGRGAP